MKNLSKKLINNITSELKGKTLEKFLISVETINTSLAHGSWINGGQRRAESGFKLPGHFYCDSMTQHHLARKDREIVSDFEWCFNYGSPRLFTIEQLQKFSQFFKKNKLSDSFYMSWSHLCIEKDEAIKILNNARPPWSIRTNHVLSPKVIKTLKDTSLDLDLPTTRIALKIVWKPLLDNSGKKVLNKMTKKLILIPDVILDFSKNVVHGQSRFSNLGTHCEACSKYIPSKKFVPLEILDKKLKKPISLWCGCDCAWNIFGIKDIGIKR